mmetsp:Transcript_37622/g.107956  ORF Transcript_37622/g.107956 Transcript_37622/m.107956 type:complete len:211 (+) Transcript_37622:276-908(+)
MHKKSSKSLSWKGKGDPGDMRASGCCKATHTSTREASSDDPAVAASAEGSKTNRHCGFFPQLSGEPLGGASLTLMGVPPQLSEVQRPGRCSEAQPRPSVSGRLTKTWLKTCSQSSNNIQKVPSEGPGPLPPPPSARAPIGGNSLGGAVLLEEPVGAESAAAIRALASQAGSELLHRPRQPSSELGASPDTASRSRTKRTLGSASRKATTA